MEWTKTSYDGVYTRESKAQKHGIGKDYSISIRYRFNGKNYQEVIGRASKGNTPKKAFLILDKLKSNQKQGIPPFTLKERTLMKLAKDEAEEQEKARIEKENISFIDFFENVYLPVTRTSKKPLSVAKEEQHVKNWIKPAIGNLPLKELKKQHIELIKNRLLEAGRTSRTVQYVLATIRQTWNAARFEGFVSGDSPTRSVKLPKVDNRRQRYLTPDECESLLTALKPHSEHVYFISVLSLDTGMRFSEIANLERQDINIFAESLFLRDTKSGRNRTVFMTDRVKELFQKMAFGKPDALVFPNRDGQRMKHISKTFDETVEKLGLNRGITDSRYKAVYHSLRHTHASRLLESGVDIYHVKELLGHQSIQTTERYTHTRDETLKNAVKRMEEKIINPQKSNHVIRLVKQSS